MFNKNNKKSKSSKLEDLKKKDVTIETIPKPFYGGNDPIIYHTKKDHPEKKQAVPLKKIRKKATPKTMDSTSKSKKMLYIGSIFAFVIVVVGISFYYINQSNKAKKSLSSSVEQEIVTEVVVPEPEEVEVVEEVVEEVEPEEVEEVIEEPESLAVVPIEFPKDIFINSVDLDSDSLTDMEEELFDTDSGTWDTDEDGYNDGREVVNLYNPKGLAPVKLIDSGTILEYVNPTWQYRVYYPIPWIVGDVDEASDQVLFSAITGDFIEIRAVSKLPDETFKEWFIKNAAGQKFTDLTIFSNRFDQEGRKRKDDLVVYFEDETVVYVMIYHPGTTGSIPYRHIMQMAYQSFRPVKVDIEIPDQVELPSETATSTDMTTTTTTTEITTPTQDLL
jgi:hypothetical protein